MQNNIIFWINIEKISILRLRKIHNLKCKDVVLPSGYTDTGYHREHYNAFKGLVKKYFTSESKSLKKPLKQRKETKQKKEASMPIDY